mmetsp:Transcript_71211/g.159393  ORF Transcript_71211/g.159393 Transcript_71211/m.159393 type:complete len:284 (-) Transcript_71211:166-1017(-)
MSVGTQLGIVVFNLFMVLFTLPAFLVAKVCVLLGAVKPMEPGCFREKLVLVFTCIMWRCTMCCAALWVRQDIEGLAEFRSTLCQSGRPAVIVSNHASFMDTILLVTYMPLAKQARIKMFVSSHLLKMPIIGTIASAMGHKAVPFKATGAVGGHELDKDLMAKRQKELELHVAGGGLAGWFPEGTMNRGDVRQIGTFRKGGFTLAVHVDVEIWCVAFNGNTTCWPSSAPVGGRPCTIRANIFRLCDSSHQYVRDAKLELGDEDGSSLHLANAAQARVQSAVKAL